MTRSWMPVTGLLDREFEEWEDEVEVQIDLRRYEEELTRVGPEKFAIRSEVLG